MSLIDSNFGFFIRFEVVCVCDCVMLVCLFAFDLFLDLVEIISVGERLEIGDFFFSTNWRLVA